MEVASIAFVWSPAQPPPAFRLFAGRCPTPLVGAGVRFLHLRLDFAYLIAKKQTLLHNTYSISFGLDF